MVSKTSGGSRRIYCRSAAVVSPCQAADRLPPPAAPARGPRPAAPANRHTASSAVQGFSGVPFMGTHRSATYSTIGRTTLRSAVVRPPLRFCPLLWERAVAHRSRLESEQLLQVARTAASASQGCSQCGAPAPGSAGLSPRSPGSSHTTRRRVGHGKSRSTSAARTAPVAALFSISVSSPAFRVSA